MASSKLAIMLSYQVTFGALLLFSLEVNGLDHSGGEFYVTFLPFAFPRYQEFKLFITTPESFPVTFTVSDPGTGYSQIATVDPGGVKEFIFREDAYTLGNIADNMKVVIISVEDGGQVFVYAAQDSKSVTDSYLALPFHDLGAASYTYIAAMVHTLAGGTFNTGETAYIHALVGIVSMENDTLLTITPTHDVNIGTESVAAGESIDVTLHRAESLLISFVGDLTGTKVTSNKPISFFSGDQCTYIPSGVAACDQIVEQLPPVEAWGRQFATVPLKARMSFDWFRIVAAENSTTVNISCTPRSGAQRYENTLVLHENGFADAQVNSMDFCWIVANKNILLLQFAVGRAADNVTGDPFMALVPAVSHYTNSFTLPVVNSSLNHFTHYLNIIIPTEHYQPDQIFLDGQSLQSLALEFVAITHNGETMAYGGQVEVNATTHTLIHGKCGGLFGVISYGFVYGASYGHIGGLQLPQLIPLTPPTELTILEVSSTSFTVSWKPPLGVRECTLYYLVNVTDTESEKLVLLQHKIKDSTLPLQVRELFPDHLHQVSVAAASREGIGSSVTVFIRTGTLAIPADIASISSNANMTVMVTLGSLLGLLLLIIITILGIGICLCRRVCRRKQIQNESAAGNTYDTYTTQNDNVQFQRNPAYETVYMTPNPTVYQE